MAHEPERDLQRQPSLTREDRLVKDTGRMLMVTSAFLLVAAWAWYFVATLLARQYPWAFSSLLLFALFLRALTIAPRGQASRVEFGLASAKVLIEYEAPKQAEAMVEKIKEAIPAEAKRALEEARPRLVEETARALTDLSERAAVQALTSSAAGVPAQPAVYAWTNLTEDVLDHWKTEMMLRAIRRRVGRKPTDQSSGSAR